MPVDSDGNVADIIMDNSSTVSRMNFGRLYETYIGGAIRDFEKRLKIVLGINSVSTSYKTINRLKELLVSDKMIVVEAYNRLLRFYQIINEEQFEFFYNLSEEKKIEHLSEVLVDGLIVHYRTDTTKDITKVIKELEEEFTPTYGPVTYVNAAGKSVTTKTPVRVGSFYILLLDKITDQYMATASATLNHFGFPSKVTSQEKHSYPHATTAARTIGETETRILTSYLGDEAVAELMDINGSVTSHKQVVKKILTNDTPMKINRIIDRAIIPYGGTKALQILKHMTRTEGWDVKYESEVN